MTLSGYTDWRVDARGRFDPILTPSEAYTVVTCDGAVRNAVEPEADFIETTCDQTTVTAKITDVDARYVFPNGKRVWAYDAPAVCDDFGSVSAPDVKSPKKATTPQKVTKPKGATISAKNMHKIVAKAAHRGHTKTLLAAKSPSRLAR